MKEYVKPVIEVIELRTEERLAASACLKKNATSKHCTVRKNTL